MSDQFTALLEGPKKFAKESVQFINRCTKPDRRGNLIISLSLLYFIIVLFGFLGILIFRIHKDFSGYCCWLSLDGIYWIFC